MRGADRPDGDADQRNEQPGKSRRLFGRGRPEPVEPEVVPTEETGWLDDLRTAKQDRSAIGPGKPTDGKSSKSGKTAPAPDDVPDDAPPFLAADAEPAPRGPGAGPPARPGAPASPSRGSEAGRPPAPPFGSPAARLLAGPQPGRPQPTMPTLPPLLTLPDRRRGSSARPGGRSARRPRLRPAAAERVAREPGSRTPTERGTAAPVNIRPAPGAPCRATAGPGGTTRR